MNFDDRSILKNLSEPVNETERLHREAQKRWEEQKRWEREWEEFKRQTQESLLKNTTFTPAFARPWQRYVYPAPAKTEVSEEPTPSCPRRGRPLAVSDFRSKYLGLFARLKQVLKRTPTRKEVWKDGIERYMTFRCFQTYLERNPDLRSLK